MREEATALPDLAGTAMKFSTGVFIGPSNEKAPATNGTFIDVLAGQADRTGAKRMTPRLGLPNQHIVGLT